MSDNSSTSPEPSSFRASTLIFGPETRYFYTIHTPGLLHSQVCVSNTKRVDMEAGTTYSRNERGGIWVEYFTTPGIKCADVMLRLFSHLKAQAEAVRAGYDIDLTMRPYAALEASSSSGDSPIRS